MYEIQHTIFRAVAAATLLYASWWGFTNACDRQKITASI